MSTTVTPQELGQFLDAVASAPVALRDVPRINSILTRLVGLANVYDKNVIGVLPPKTDPHTDAVTAGFAAEAAATDDYIPRR